MQKERIIEAGAVDGRGHDKPPKETWPLSPDAGNPTKHFQEGITESNMPFKEIIQAVLGKADSKRMVQAIERPEGREVRAM